MLGWTKSDRQATGFRRAVLRSSCRIHARGLAVRGCICWEYVFSGVWCVFGQHGRRPMRCGAFALVGVCRMSCANTGAWGGVLLVYAVCGWCIG